MPTAPDHDLINTRSEPVTLSKEGAFRLGRVEIRPATREIIGTVSRQILQPRVMQVLVVLHRSSGEVISRGDLTAACWNGVVVGEDSINRVISQLRRAAETIGGGSFGIETITKVGYRLISTESPVSSLPKSPAATATTGSGLVRRRALFVGAGIFIVTGAIGGRWLLTRGGGPPSPTPSSVDLLEQALMVGWQGTREGHYQSIGLLRLAVAEQPDFADGWGALSMMHAFVSHARSREEVDAMRARAIEAADRADAIDPGNAYAAVGRAIAQPSRGTWLATEQALRAAMARHPKQVVLMTALSAALVRVGRNRETLAMFEERARVGDNSPVRYAAHIQALWATGRLEDADRMMEEAHQLYATHFLFWFTRVYILLYTGRVRTALDILRDVLNRPTGIPQEQFEDVQAVAQALLSRLPSEIDTTIRIWRGRAQTGAGYAENAAQFASVLGHVDEAFAILQAYYFGRGFTVPDVRFTVEQGSYTPLNERNTAFLFQPSMAPVRSDPRFRQLVDEIGLTAYWQDSGSRPDVAF